MNIFNIFSKKTKQEIKSNIIHKFDPSDNDICSFLKKVNDGDFGKIFIRELSCSRNIFTHDEINVIKTIEQNTSIPIQRLAYSYYSKNKSNKKLFGYRFTLNNEDWDIFTDGSSGYCYGKSDNPNHNVFDLNWNYLGDIEFKDTSIYSHLFFNILENHLWNNFSGEKSLKYMINLENGEISSP